MAVQKIGFVGIRSGDLKGLRRILEEGLGLITTDASDQQVGYDLSDGTRVEGFSESEEFTASSRQVQSSASPSMISTQLGSSSVICRSSF